MNMKILKKTLLFLLIICQSFLFVACRPVDAIVSFFSDDGTGHIFKIALDSDPECLDPQLATDKNSIAVAKNLFAGLMEYDASGKLVCRMAKDYSISDDGLKYTFYLKEGYNWYAAGDKEYPVKAADFVFGFKRLMDPLNASVHSEKYFCIAGAEAARKGTGSLDDIGVRAIDDYTVEFTLSYPNAEFLPLLAELPAMPCCEEFFIASQGKYGLEASNTCSNGPFYLRYWLYDPYGKNNYVRLRRNPGYSDVDFVAPAGINYLITKDREERETDYQEGSTDVIVYPCGSAADTEKGYIASYSATAGLVLNKKSASFDNPEVRELFSMAAGRDNISANAPEILLKNVSLVPESGAAAARGYTSAVPEETVSDNLSMAEYKWSFLLTEREKSEFIGMTVMVCEDFSYGYLIESITDSWYSAFGIHFGIETVNSRDYEQRLKTGDYDIALVALESDTSSPLDFISPFGSENRFGYVFDEAKEAESGAGRYQSVTALNYACSEAEKAVLGSHCFIPLWQLPTVCAFDSDIEGLRVDPCTGAVIFEDAKKF